MIALTFGPVLTGIDGSVFITPQVDVPGSSGSTTLTQFRVGAQLGVRL
jgi:hypothetical protein